ncbi:hypothetical protein FW755_04900 [Lonepinella koalarum]|uniref:hypothetical protein n=1 Tax=Lonepinella koalarum TaxID=53417 RepID=UPI0011E3DDF0|nr:hypothetical protein FW755_04900 [Lonepinella koalarum]
MQRMNYADAYSALIKRYQDILMNNDSVKRLLAENDLSHLHLGFVPENYSDEKVIVLFIGRETRGWKIGDDINEYNLETIKKSIAKSKNWFENPKLKRGHGFFNYVKQLEKDNPIACFLWANIFACDYKKGCPTKLKDSILFNEIEILSVELIKAQIEILKPNIVIFASGNQGVQTRRKYFENLKPSGKRIDESLDKKYLERFYFSDNPKIICYRTVHPSARREEPCKALRTLRTLLKRNVSELTNSKLTGEKNVS